MTSTLQPAKPIQQQQQQQQNNGAPARSSSVPILVTYNNEEYPSQMARLHEMGFKDESRNRQVLKHTQGRLESAVDILSRLPGAPQQPKFDTTLHLTDEQKIMRLNDLSFTDIPENREALRRSGGNLEVAIGILQNARKPTPTPPPSSSSSVQNNVSTKPDPLSAFSTPLSSSDNKDDPAGRVQNVRERQNHTLSGMKTADLLGLLDDNKPMMTGSNPFHQTNPIQQQQAHYTTTASTTNPFGLNNGSLSAPSPLSARK